MAQQSASGEIVEKCLVLFNSLSTISFIIFWFLLEIKPDKDTNKGEHPKVKKFVHKVF
jgi:hypothetical protein